MTIISISKSSIYNFINEGKIPAPIKIGRASRWRLSEISEALGLRFDADTLPGGS